MKILKYSLLIVAGLIILASACGQGEGNNPIGVTGGGAHGYGTGGGPVTDYGNAIIGTWRKDYNPSYFVILNFYSEGKFLFELHDDLQLYLITGTYYIADNKLTLKVNGEDGQTVFTTVCTFVIDGNLLTLYYNEYESETYYRVK